MVPVGLFHQTLQPGHGLDLITTEAGEFPLIKLDVVASSITSIVEFRGTNTTGRNLVYSLSTLSISSVAKSKIIVIDTKLFVAIEPVVGLIPLSRTIRASANLTPRSCLSAFQVWTARPPPLPIGLPRWLPWRSIRR